jgi:hypothetical protein
MENLIGYLGCGKYYHRSTNEIGELVVTSSHDNINKIIPFFDKYPILGMKAKDFEDFKAAALIIQNKAHIKQPGLSHVLKIKAGMNANRK